ncbi:MAG: T9SS type A sorting domain-containing protein, partial [candidate division Zixibacteria bacterium]|nr:T9SS type A sorting domain-containing protein [candidate division Zixibacteria bacterium]
QMHLYVPPDNPRQYGGELMGALATMQLSNYPNVFNSRTRIDYKLSEDGHVKLEIFDIIGKRVDILIDGYKEAGEHSIVWNAENYPSGVYFCVLTQGIVQATQKMALVK